MVAAHEAARVQTASGAAGAHRAAAFALSAVILAVSTASIFLAVVNIGSPGPDFRVLRDAFVPDVALALLYAPLGAFVVVRTGHVIGWALQLVAIGFGSTAFAIQYAILGVEHPGLPGYAAVSQLVLVGWAVGALTAMLVVPWLIGRQVPSGPPLVAAVAGLFLVLLAGVTRYLIQLPDGPVNAVAGTGRVADLARGYDAWMIPVYFLGGVAGAAYLAARARRADPAERFGTGWVVVSVLLVACCYMLFEIGLSLEGPLLGVGAADVLAQRFSQARFSVTVEAEDPDRIDTGRQVAIDHIAAEGVLNAHRHAGARHCQVALTRLDGQTVRLTVTDDGEGVGGSATPGIGLASMRERAVELGGTFTIDSAGRGTRVTVELP
jgi:hypothetical protein